MGKKDYYKHGDYNVICDRCGFKYKASECVEDWEGFLVCLEKCYEPRHPQDFVRATKDDQSVPVARTDPGEDSELIEESILLESSNEFTELAFLLTEGSGRINTEKTNINSITADDL